ncbi:MAG: tandem-95 repeat protein, partial [Dehalococcoidia bacterium]
EFVCTGGGVGNFAPASKIIDNMTAANALTLEAWVIPSSLDQGTSSRRIVSVSEDRGTTHLNLQLNQKKGASKYKLRTDDFNSLTVNNIFSDTATMKHMVVTFDGLTQRMYIDGMLRTPTLNVIGDTGSWDLDYPVTIGNDASLDRGWLGRIFLVAAYDKSLSAAEITQNFNAGSGATFPVPTASTNPDPGTGLVTTLVTHNQIKLDWQPPASPSSCVDEYLVYRDGVLLDDTTPSSFTDNDVQPDTTYTYEVSVISHLGLESVRTAPLVVTSASDPTPPAISSLEASPNSLKIVFDEAVDSVTATNIGNYSISNGIGVTGASLAANQTTVTLNTTAHTDGVTYTLTTSNVEDLVGNVMLPTNTDYLFVLGLVGHWTLDDGAGPTANDSSGLGHHGTLVNSPLWTTGQVDGALQYDRALQQSLLVNHSPMLNFGGNSFSMSLWVRYTDSEDTDLVRKGSTATASDWYKMEILEGQRLGFNLNTSNVSAATALSPLAYNDGAWHHVAGVRDFSQGLMLLYIDGQLVQTRNNPAGTINSTANLTIGSKDTVNDDFLNGYLDDVRLYNRAISPQEVTELFNMSSSSSNTSPVADDQSVATDEDAALGITLTAADPEAPPQTLNFAVLTQPASGALSGAAPNLTYTPDPDFNGADSFTFRANDGVADSNIATVDITVNPVNDLPVADDQTVVTSEDVALGIVLTATDVDLPPQTLTYNVLTQPVNGVLSGTAPNLTYTPDPAYNGLDSFTFQVNDGVGGSNIATVDITVFEANDPPVADDQALATDEDVALGITLTATDVDLPPQTLTYSVMTPPSNGTLSGTAPNLTYTPNQDFNGADSFTFQANDGIISSNVATVDIAVNAINDLPVADSQAAATNEDTALGVTLTASDVDLPPQTLTFSVMTPPSNGALSGTAPNLTYTPNPGYFGADSFTFQANDGVGNSNIATVDLTVTEINDLPVADSQAVATSEDTA